MWCWADVWWVVRCIVGTSISSVLQPGWASRALCSIRGLLVWMVRQGSCDSLQSHWCVTPADGRVSLTEAVKEEEVLKLVNDRPVH